MEPKRLSDNGITSATGSWGSRGSGGGMVAGSPGVGGMSNSSSSSSGASWRSGTPSPPLSEEGVPMRSSPCPTTSHHPSHNPPHYPYNVSGSSSGSTPGSTTLDEGIVPDYIEEQHPRKKVSNLGLWVFDSSRNSRARSSNPGLLGVSRLSRKREMIR